VGEQTDGMSTHLLSYGRTASHPGSCSLSCCLCELKQVRCVYTRGHVVGSKCPLSLLQNLVSLTTRCSCPSGPPPPPPHNQLLSGSLP
jgi:hypothetical protein